jgi:zinc transporter ZupT
MIYLTALFAAALALIHLLIGKLRFLDVVPRSRWLSASGGVAVAYVFLHILPELSSHQETFAKGLGLGEQAAEGWVYLVALTGLATFYGLERAVKISRGRSRNAGGADVVEAKTFWIHIGSFGLYNVIIGYLLLHREETGLWPLVAFFVAMSLHFVTNDFGLRQHHKERYDRSGRWVIAGTVVAGWALGTAAALPELVIGFLFAFLAGSVVLNVLKEELPEERQSRFRPFAAGCAACATLLLAGA